MGSSDVPPERLAAPPAVETDHIIVMNGSADRHCRDSRGGFYRPIKASERLLDGRDQTCNLVGTDLIAPDIRRDDFRGEFSIG